MKEGRKAFRRKERARDGQCVDLGGLPVIQYVQSLVYEEMGVREGTDGVE